MPFDAIQDYKDMLIADFVHTNVTTTAADPVIYIRGEEDNAVTANGEIIIEKVELLQADYSGDQVQNKWKISATVHFESSTADTILIETMEEIERIHNAENVLSTRSWEHWNLAFPYDGNHFTGLIEYTVEMHYNWVAINT